MAAVYQWDPTRQDGGLTAVLRRIQYEGADAVNEATRTSRLISCGQDVVDQYSADDMYGTHAWLCPNNILQMPNPVPFPGTPGNSRNFYPRLAVSDLLDRVFIGRMHQLSADHNIGMDTMIYFSPEQLAFLSDEFTEADWLDLLDLETLDGLDPYTLRVRT